MEIFTFEIIFLLLIWLLVKFELNENVQFCRYFNVFGDGIHTAGGRLGNDNHYIEQHEKAHNGLGLFQKKVKKNC